MTGLYGLKKFFYYKVITTPLTAIGDIAIIKQG